MKPTAEPLVASQTGLDTTLSVPQLALERVSKTYGDGRVQAVRDFTLTVLRGTFVTILGPSGCGKTTLLHLIAGLLRPDTGEIFIRGRRVNDLSPRDRNVAMVFQNYALYPHMTVRDNIALGLKLRKYPRDEIERRVRAITEMLGIADLLDRYPRQLSGGQQQRVALARALVREPDVFLLDEPLSNLDAHVREATRTEMKRLFKEMEATVVYVTHDQVEALSLSDIIVVMEQGVIRQVGDPISIYQSPAHRFVAEFVGTPRINMVPGVVEDGAFVSDDHALVMPLNRPTPRRRVWFGIRPEHIRLGAPTGDHPYWTGIVRLMEPLGAQILLIVQVGMNDLRVLVQPGTPIRVGASVTLTVDPARVLLFDAETERRL